MTQQPGRRTIWIAREVEVDIDSQTDSITDALSASVGFRVESVYSLVTPHSELASTQSLNDWLSKVDCSSPQLLGLEAPLVVLQPSSPSRPSLSSASAPPSVSPYPVSLMSPSSSSSSSSSPSQSTSSSSSSSKMPRQPKTRPMSSVSSTLLAATPARSIFQAGGTPRRQTVNLVIPLTDKELEPTTQSTASPLPVFTRPTSHSFSTGQSPPSSLLSDTAITSSSTAGSLSSGEHSGTPRLKKWKQKQDDLNRAREEARNKQVFGVPLEELLVRPTASRLLETGSATAALVPEVIVSLVNYLRKNALQTEGLFRLAGNHSSILEMKKLMDQGDCISWEQFDIHSVANILKTFIRELPEPLFSFSFFPRWIAAIRATGDQINLRMDYLLALLSALPKPNRNALRYLLTFFKELSDNSTETKMDAHNLAVVWGPNLLQSPTPITDSMELICVQLVVIELVEIFIELVETLFDDLENVPPFLTYRSLNSYTQQNPSELTIEVNDIVHVFKKSDDTWFGEVNGQIGSFPHSSFRYQKTTQKPNFRDWKQRSLKNIPSTSSPTTATDYQYYPPPPTDGVATRTIPRGFNPAEAELFLSDVDFFNLLGCTKTQYRKFPTWKQAQLKERAGLSL